MGPCKSFGSNTDLKNMEETNKYLVGIYSFDRTNQLLKDSEFWFIQREMDSFRSYTG